MKLVVDENIPLVNDFFSGFGAVIKLPGREISQSDILDTDALLIRSVTSIDKALLAGSSVKFIGSATIGCDHVDRTALKKLGITFTNAPGCNASAVAEYTISAILALVSREKALLSSKRVAIVGYGNVGRALFKKLGSLVAEIVVCDPYVEKSVLSGLCEVESLISFVPYAEVSGYDIVSFHVPLVCDGAYSTYHMVNAAFLSELKPGTILLNSARGGVVDNQALRACLENGQNLLTVIDVWEEEPAIDGRLLELVDIATPHIAGYSHEGKLRGTEALYFALCQFLGKEPEFSMASFLKPLLESDRVLSCCCLMSEGFSSLSLLPVYDIWADSKKMKTTLLQALQSKGSQYLAREFDQLRKTYSARREFENYSVSLGAENRDYVKTFEDLGFCVKVL